MNPFEKLEKKDPVKPAQVSTEKKLPEEPEKAEKRIDHPSSQPTQVLVSNTDAYILDRMRSQPKSLEEIDVKNVTEKGPEVHRLSLPDEVKRHEDRYVFRWIYKVKRAIDEAIDLRGWVLVNRFYFPDLPTHLFGTNGGIERGDNILAFMPRKKAEELKMVPIEKSRQMLNSTLGKHKGDPRYYVPKDEETENVIGI